MTQHNRETLLALAERCEKATGDSFDLNHAIALALGIASEPFTASLDAAMALAKDFGGEVTFFKDGTAKAYLWQPYPLAVEWRAATPALALCAASLRARATLDPTGEKA